MLAFVMSSRPGTLVDFEFGLDLLLDGLERRLATGPMSSSNGRPSLDEAP
jgi:hypothetical protein